MRKYLTKDDFFEKDFYIDSFNLDRIFKEDSFLSYKIKIISVGRIIMPYPGAYIKVGESPVYQFLNGNHESEEKYKLYCKKYGKFNPNRTVDNYKELINDFSLEDYDIKKGVIIVNQANVLLDGQHRSCLILKKYGKNHKIQVLEITDKDCTFHTRIRIMKDLIMHKKITEI